VVVCALGFERCTDPPGTDRHGNTSADRPAVGRWTDVVTAALGIPDLPALRTDGILGDRAVAGANFRNEYYGLVPAVVDAAGGDGGGDGAPLVTTGLIDPGRCRWGHQPARFARRRFEAPAIR